MVVQEAVAAVHIYAQAIVISIASSMLGRCVSLQPRHAALYRYLFGYFTLYHTQSALTLTPSLTLTLYIYNRELNQIILTVKCRVAISLFF